MTYFYLTCMKLIVNFFCAVMFYWGGSFKIGLSCIWVYGKRNCRMSQKFTALNSLTCMPFLTERMHNYLLDGSYEKTSVSVEVSSSYGNKKPLGHYH